MEFVYTQHTEEKLRRKDIQSFGINKKLLEKAIKQPTYTGKTKTGEKAVIILLDEKYILRVIYVNISLQVKVITFYIAKKGRYNT